MYGAGVGPPPKRSGEDVRISRCSSGVRRSPSARNRLQPVEASSRSGNILNPFGATLLSVYWQDLSEVIMSIRFEQQHRWDERPSADGPGIYAYFVIASDGIPLLSTDPSVPIYVGMTESSLDARCHFDHKSSGFSTFRRSLGAILKKKLSLRAVPRSSGASETNVKNYAFADGGEGRLTDWMRANLTYSHQPLPSDVREREREIIAALQPRLNLTGWANPIRDQIKRLRADCVHEARQGR